MGSSYSAISTPGVTPGEELSLPAQATMPLRKAFDVKRSG